MRVLFLGTSEFAIPTLEALAASPEHEVLAVVTQPDRPQGRGQHVATSPVKRCASKLCLPVLQPRRVRSGEFIETARSLAPDVLVLAAFGQIIPQALLDLPPAGPINLHGSLLPAYRGAAPIQHAILNGEQRTGATTMWMDASLDTGDILLQREVAILPDDDTGALTARLADVGARLVLDTLAALSAGTCRRTVQDGVAATWAPALTPDDARLRWSEPAERVRNRVRAMAPRPGAYTEIAGRRLKVWSASVVDASAAAGRPGTVLAIGRESVDVQAGGGAVRLVDVQQEGARRMPASAWARGARIGPGATFTA